METKFEQALDSIAGPSPVQVEQRKQAEVRKFHADLAPAVTFAGNAIETLQKFFGQKVFPFIERVNQANLHDIEIARWLHDLQRLTEKPDELRLHLHELEKVSWRELRQSTFPDQIDTYKRDNLRREYEGLLTRFGDVEGRATGLMALIRTRVELLAELARERAVQVSPNIAPSIEEAGVEAGE